MTSDLLPWSYNTKKQKDPVNYMTQGKATVKNVIQKQQYNFQIVDKSFYVVQLILTLKAI